MSADRARASSPHRGLERRSGKHSTSWPAAAVSGLDTEQPRYYLQHALGFQVHDIRHPHRDRRHGRADIGWKDGQQDG